ncbi:MAG TPA: aspartate kinase [Prolixibacteraceae bacterium]|nr:aspartate kinase [Prolixibacteraceae bacterium]
MKVFKFGGASVKDAAGVMQTAKIICAEQEQLIVVVSAMGKTTDALVAVTRNYFDGKIDEALRGINKVKEDHFQIVSKLFESGNEKLESTLHDDFDALLKRMNIPPSLNYDFEYDQIVSTGEMVSTEILATYLNHVGRITKWIDAGHYIRTNDTWREGEIDWNLTRKLLPQAFQFNENSVCLTQGFIGATTFNLTTTLGREGSDYTAAVVANIMNAESVTIWKDVPGIMNADPHKYPRTYKLEKLSYREAVEMTYYGAKVIHPKTMKPLVEKQIPLYVKSFIHPDEEGSMICNIDHPMEYIPVFINKEDQVLITVSPKDFSFIAEESIANIYRLFSKFRMKVNLVQQSAMNFSLAIDRPERDFEQMIQDLSEHFVVHYNDGLELLTIRYFTPEAVAESTSDRTIYVEQRTRKIVRFLLR